MLLAGISKVESREKLINFHIVNDNLWKNRLVMFLHNYAIDILCLIEQFITSMRVLITFW